MLSIFYSNSKLDIEKIFIFLILAATFTPSFNALDNNAIRWNLLTIISGLYLIKTYFSNDLKQKINKSLNIFFTASILYFIFSIFKAANFNEALISGNKIFTIFLVFITSLLAFKKIENGIIYISKIFTVFLFIECSYIILESLFSNNYFTGIASNRNISSSSILTKLGLLIYLNYSSILSKYRLYLKIIEFLAIYSIIILESRLGIGSIFLIYLFLFIRYTLKRKEILMSIFLMIFSFFASNNFNSDETSSNNGILLDLSSDESLNQRLSFYEHAIDLITQKPIFGHGIGSWKYESINYVRYEEDRLLIPYYTHNDFLQLTVEAGILGVLIYLIFIINILLFIFKQFRKESFFIPIIITFIYFILNSLINFPLSRSQELIPVILLSALILSYSSNKNSESKRPYLILVLIFMLIPSCYLYNQEHKSSIVQKIVLNDYEKNIYSLNINQVDQIEYRLPNIAVNTVPISTYLSRYYFEEKDYRKSLELLSYSLKVNKYDFLTKELLLKNYIFLNQKENAYTLVKSLINDYPNNFTYGQIYFSLVLDLNKFDELVADRIIYKSNNINIHRLFFSTLEKRGLNNEDYFEEFFKYSKSVFPDL